MEKPSLIKRIWNIVSSILVAIIVLIAVVLMGARLMGFEVYNVVSGSMEPTYSVGDLIYVKKIKGKNEKQKEAEVEKANIKEGTPITFVLNQDLVVATHRVVKVDEENKCFYTKGDANDTADATPVHYQNVIGVPKFSVPLLGYVSDFVQHPPGMYITVGVGIVLIAAVFLPDIIGKKKKTKDIEVEVGEEQQQKEEI